jgi:hypothetical protein
MALVLNTNSYVTLDEAELYFETRIDSANWFNSEDEIKEQALVTATQIVDNHAWIGSAISPSQALAWPRKNAIYNDPRLGLTVSVAENEIPQQVKVAVYEQALHLIDNEDLLSGTTQTFESIKIGSIAIEDKNSDTTKTPMKAKLVVSTIKPLLRSSGTSLTWWRAN